MKSSLRIKIIMVTLCILLIFIMLKTLAILNPKEKAKYCIDDKCITIVLQYDRVISGGNSKLRIYKRNIYTRYFLGFGDYAEFPIETHFLLSKQLFNNKILISSQSIPIVKGGLGDRVVFQELDYYSEGDKENISSFDLEYESF
ncbi:hypothetical protein [Psychrobacter lutiphocae]|uniref:hypothetical protein n=1 Tax=Psychrobacter lutiphocae TaxID=540500 RepID=UPI00037523DC|nr:hypothetical protein [Psychrobacter lutiphocae]